MEYIRSQVRIFCPATGRVETVYYRMIKESGLIYCPGCEHYKDSPSCRRCVESITKKLQSTAAADKKP